MGLGSEGWGVNVTRSNLIEVKYMKDFKYYQDKGVHPLHQKGLVVPVNTKATLRVGKQVQSAHTTHIVVVTTGIEKSANELTIKKRNFNKND